MLTSRVLPLVLILTACSAPVQVVADYVSGRHASTQTAVAKAPLNPAYQYLLVTVKGKSFLMARGAVEQSAGGSIEVWYSGNREVLKLQRGRIVATAGTPVEWSGVVLSGTPAWEAIDAPIHFERHRDVMPGYHFGLSDQLTVTPISGTPSNHFYGDLPSGLRWFREVSSGPYALPVATYAVRVESGHAEVIYGEQCLSESLCFSWQRWPNRT